MCHERRHNDKTCDLQLGNPSLYKSDHGDRGNTDVRHHHGNTNILQLGNTRGAHLILVFTVKKNHNFLTNNIEFQNSTKLSPSAP